MCLKMPVPLCSSTLLEGSGERYLMKDSGTELKNLFPLGSNLITEKMFFIFTENWLLSCLFPSDSDVSRVTFTGRKM